MVIERVILVLAVINLVFLFSELAFNVLGQVLPAMGIAGMH